MRQRWILAALAIYALIVAVVVLAPISYSGIVDGIDDWFRRGLQITWFGSAWIEFGANILMFVPLGYLLTLLFRHHWYGAVLAFALSVAAEALQSIIPSREASLRDILANALGAGLGAALAWFLVVRRDPGLGTVDAEPH